jgi:hypothetical protein
MSRYLSRLKQITNETFSGCIPDTPPSKPSKLPFEPFEGCSLGDISQNLLANEGQQTMRRELTDLVRFCGEAYAFTEEEHAEALQRALADCDSAMICFRAIKREILLGAKGASEC